MHQLPIRVMYSPSAHPCTGPTLECLEEGALGGRARDVGKDAYGFAGKLRVGVHQRWRKHCEEGRRTGKRR